MVKIQVAYNSYICGKKYTIWFEFLLQRFHTCLTTKVHMNMVWRLCLKIPTIFRLKSNNAMMRQKASRLSSN